MEEKTQQESSTYEDLLAKITHPKQRLFLENYPKFKYLTKTTEAIGIHWQSVYNWQESSKPFLEAFEALKKHITASLIATHEKNIHDVALDTKTKDQSRIFGSLCILRANDPKKWREKVDAIPFTGNIKVELSVPRPGEATKQLPEGEDNGQD